MIAHYLLLAIALLAVSQAGNLIRLCETSAITITFYRLLLASLLMLPFSIRRLIKAPRVLGLRTMLTIFIMATAFSSHFFAWISAIQRTKVADAAICFALSPLFTALGGHLFLNERITRSLWFALAMGLAGVIAVSGGDFSLSHQYLAGDLQGLLSGFLFSIHCLLGRTLRKNISNLDLMTLVYVIGVGLSLIFVWLLNAPLTGFSIRTKVGFLALAVFPTIIGHASLIYSMKFFRAATVSLLVLLEPVLAGIVAYFAWGEVLTRWSYVGYALIVGGLMPFFYFSTRTLALVGDQRDAFQE